jgi:[acyl-carrier-protein] S-malonyltransferase
VSRALVAFPGRGSYTAASLGSLRVDHPWVHLADEMRAELGLPSLSELDRAPHFDPPVHLRAANASPLTFLVGMLDAERIAVDHDVVATVGNSTGWYTALAATGALPFEDAFRIVQELALLQERPLPADGPGGQVIYPLMDALWRPDPSLAKAVDHALAAGNGNTHRSIELGGYAVLAGTESGIDRLLNALPRVTVGQRAFPLRLALHDPSHTPLVKHVADAAREQLTGLRWQAPTVTLIDGRGMRFTPWSADANEIARYTLDEQLTTPYRFATALRVALREHAPQVIVLPGPGNSLGGICGQVIVAEGYRGLRTRAAFEEAQAGTSPILLSIRK